MTKLEQAARQALGALEVATTPLAKDRQEVLRAITTLREALSGVQALSAAPAIGDELRDTLVAVSAAIAERDDRAAQKMIREILAASTTPPAEQQATKETSGGFHVWRDISTAPKDGSRFVATGHNYGLYSEVRHTCVAQWFQGCWMEASDWNETSELKYLTHWMPLPSPPDDVAAPAEQQAQPGAVYAELPQPDSWFHFTAQFWENKLRDFADRTHALRMQAAPKAAPGDVLDESLRERDDAEDFIDALLDEVLGHERPEWSNLYGRADALNDVQERMTSLHKPAVDKAWGQFQSAMAAPQQEAQEPAFWMNEKGHTWSHSDWKQFPKHRAKYPIPLYAHRPPPQPAPDCHHRPPCDECAALAAQGGK